MLSLTNHELEQEGSLACAIAEDIVQNLDHLKMVLASVCPEVKLLHETNSLNGLTEILQIPNLHLDFIFLDVFLADGISFDLADILKKRNIDIVFYSAYSEYSLKAFNVNAAHFLMKPLDPDALKEAIRRVKIRRAFSRQEDNSVQPSDPANGHKLLLSAKDGTHIIDHDEILHCQGDNNYTDIWLRDGQRIKCSQTLSKIALQLEGSKQFYRIHKSHLINLNDLVKIINQDGGHLAELKTGKEVPIAKRRYKAFRTYLKGWKGN